MRWLADVVYAVAALVYFPVALYNALVLKKNRSGWSERFGKIENLAPGSRRIWVHAVSLGEVNAAARLIEALAERVPEAQVVISTTTDTGYARAVQLYGPSRVFRFPLDFSWVIRRAMETVRPVLLVLVELEIWPNLVSQARERGIPVAVVNGRLTQRSARRLARLGPLGRGMFKKIAWVGAQDKTIATRFRQLGVSEELVEITGSMKWDTAVVADRVSGDAELASALGLDRSRLVWVCGSTGADEESILLDAYERVVQQRGIERSPRLILVPRKPERFDEVAELIVGRGHACVRRSQRRGNSTPEELATNAVILGDTMGELRAFYCLADFVFLGRTLVPMGGSDPMEVAGLGKPIISGPHTENFEGPVRALREGGSLMIVDSAAALRDQVNSWLDDPDSLKERGRRGQKIVAANQGATNKTVHRLMQLLGQPEAAAATFQERESGLRSQTAGEASLARERV